MAAAKALRNVDADVTLIDRTNHHLFQPLLYQVATAALSPADIATANRVLLRRQSNATVLMAEVIGVDTDRRTVQVDCGPDLAYDYLVLATDAAYSYFGHEEWAANSATLKTLDDALSIRERLLGAFEFAEQASHPEHISRWLTFVIVGGGPTGVELAGTIAELARTTLVGEFRKIDPRSARIMLCEAGDRLLATFPKHLSVYSARALASLGVEVCLNSAVNQIDADGLSIGTTRVEAATVLWCAGTQARPAARWTGADAARNFAIKVTSTCSVPGHANIFAIGDVASFEPGSGKPLPGLAPVAKLQGTFVGRLLAARVAGRSEPSTFHYRDYGAMAIIGRSRAIANFGWLKITGFPAWLAWSIIHLGLLVDSEAECWYILTGLGVGSPTGAGRAY